MRFRPSPYVLLVLANVLWAGNWVIGRAMRGDIPPLALSFWRWMIALMFILPLARPHLRRDWPMLTSSWRWLALFGLLGTATYNALAYVGLQYTTATNGLLLNSFVPVAIVALGWAFMGKRLRSVELLGVAISLLGVLTIVARGDPRTLTLLELNIGDAWVIASVLAWAIYTLLLPHRPNVHPLSFLAGISFFGLLELAPAYGWEIASGRRMTLDWTTLAAIAYTGVFAALLGFVFWNRGVAEVGPAKAGLYYHLLPVFGIALSIFFLAEQPEVYHALGVALIFTGIGLNGGKPR
ncbi:MAG: DMT family transporter [Rhodocyclaceae bacterium]|nr:DMT family transporter [Rhodocyclaceae bacterium]MBK6552508.1 DMT family transporter [Rhodocyclaceae bacterium]MBK9312044.1 DMT family transporter [Rhodocyclaceae bacterium]